MGYGCLIVSGAGGWDPGTLWDPMVGPYAGTLWWDPMLGPDGGTLWLLACLFACLLVLFLYCLDSGLWTLDSGLWTRDSGLWTLDSGLWTLDSRLRTVPRVGCRPFLCLFVIESLFVLIRLDAGSAWAGQVKSRCLGPMNHYYMCCCLDRLFPIRKMSNGTISWWPTDCPSYAAWYKTIYKNPNNFDEEMMFHIVCAIYCALNTARSCTCPEALAQTCWGMKETKKGKLKLS